VVTNEATARRQAARLLDVLDRATGPVPVVGIYDPLSARRAAHAGFDAVFVSGRSVAQAAFSTDHPYVRAVDAEDYTAYVGHICAATAAPVIADAEDGFSDPVETCRKLERAGAAGVQLQDGAEQGGLFPTDQMCKTISAVREATDLVVIARTDRLAGDRADALSRLRAFRMAGAHLVMAGLSPVAREVFIGSPLLAELVDAADGGLVVFTPDGRRLLPVYALPKGVRIVLLTAAIVDRATATIDETLQHLFDLAGVTPE
jgi:2-methylisocitrate lyase-like PEP mutase family enzyme